MNAFTEGKPHAHQFLRLAAPLVTLCAIYGGVITYKNGVLTQDRHEAIGKFEKYIAVRPLSLWTLSNEAETIEYWRRGKYEIILYHVAKKDEETTLFAVDGSQNSCDGKVDELHLSRNDRPFKATDEMEGVNKYTTIFDRHPRIATETQRQYRSARDRLQPKLEQAFGIRVDCEAHENRLRS